MPIKQLSITFEPNVSVVGQILILEAVDFLYSIAVLQEVGWSQEAQQLPEWRRFLATSPGKLLARENVLTVRSAHSSAVTEVLDGADKGVDLFTKLLNAIINARLASPSQKLHIINEQLFPLIENLKKAGASEEQIKGMTARVVLYSDQVLADLMAKQKVKILARSASGG
jgi:hypothetical protein